MAYPDETTYYMNLLNQYKFNKRIDEIKNRKNVFLPNINNKKYKLKYPKKKFDEQEIEKQNFTIFKRLLSIDNRLPKISSRKYLNKRYLSIKKKERKQFTQLENNMRLNTNNLIDKKLLYMASLSKSNNYNQNKSNNMNKSYRSDNNSNSNNSKEIFFY